MSHLFLSWWEVLLTRLLMRSKRIGSIVIREYGENVHWVLHASHDPFLTRRPEPEPDAEPELEPPSMLLERLFHAPDANR